jgi:[ribosomal protein S5]-alanine N-acetyltransferase
MTLPLALGHWAELALHITPLRHQVFVREQSLPDQLVQDTFEANATHAVLFEHAKVVGSARLLADGSIGGICVSAAHRRRGHGALLLNALSELAVERGFAQVKLSAPAGTVSLYERHGFLRLGAPTVVHGMQHQDLFKQLRGCAPWPEPAHERPADLLTPDLLLRPGLYSDAPAVRAAMQSWDVVQTLMLPPWPYLHGHALGWMNTYVSMWQQHRAAPWMMIEKSSQQLVGTIGLRAGLDGGARPVLGNVGYWVAQPHWGKGFATQALKAVIEYGFTALAMHRIDACHLAHNRASGRVMQRAGMRQEGIRRAYSKGRDGQWHDDVLYSILSTDLR